MGIKLFVERLSSKLFGFVTLVSSPLIDVFEKRLIGKYGDEPIRHQPVFIIGAPRTGSTILYQSLTNKFVVKYIDNLAARWFRNLFFGMWLSNIRYGDGTHQNFSADQGNTKKYGGHAPNECGAFWYRWLPKNEHFVDASGISDSMAEEIRREITAITNYYDKPMIFKNLNAGQRLGLLSKIFPDAKYIYIRRDPMFVVKSILQSRRRANIQPGEWWSIKPKNYQSLLTLSETELCAAQVFYLEKQIRDDLNKLSDKNYVVLQNHELSSQRITKIAKWLGLEERSNASFPTFKKDDDLTVGDQERAKIQTSLDLYDFEKEALK